MSNIFVYGTLLSGLDNHNYLDNATFIGSGETSKKYTMFLSYGLIPKVIKSPKYKIKGEVYLVNDKDLSQIDRLEHKYIREKVTVKLLNKNIECFMYIYPKIEKNNKNLPHHNGCFKDYLITEYGDIR